MVKLQLNHLLFIVLPGALLATGCLPRGGVGARDRNGNDADSSILADIGGISDDDIGRKPNYTLLCEGSPNYAGAIQDGGKTIRFAGSEAVKAGAKCSMEVRLTADELKKDDYKTWEWHGYVAGAAVPGFMYGSSVGVVSAEHKLALTLYRLYTVPGDFTAKFAVTFEFAAGQTMPSPAPATITCGAQTWATNTVTKDSDKDATYTFSLAADAMKGKTCEKFGVLVDNKLVYEGPMTGVVFAAPFKGKEYLFPATGRITLKPAVIVGGGVEPVITNGGDCYRFENNECKDRKSVDLKAASYLYVKVAGKKGENAEKVELIAVPGATGLGLQAAGIFKIEDIQEALKGAYSDLPGLKWNFYKVSAGAKIQELAFDAKLVKGTGLEADKATAADLQNVKVLHIEKVWSHGWKKLADEAALNALKSPYWMARVKATKDTVTYDLVATGAIKYFESPTSVTVNNVSDYYDWTKIVTEMKTGSSSTWKMYAMKTASMPLASCLVEWSYFAADIGAMHLGQIKNETTGLNASLDACELKGTDWKDLTGFTEAPEFFHWTWLEL